MRRPSREVESAMPPPPDSRAGSLAQTDPPAHTSKAEGTHCSFMVVGSAICSSSSSGGRVRPTGSHSHESR